jgi:hypothetical protein
MNPNFTALTLGQFFQVCFYCCLSAFVYLIVPMALDAMPVTVFMVCASTVGLVCSVYRLLKVMDRDKIAVDLRKLFKSKADVALSPFFYGVVLMAIPNLMILNSFTRFPVSKTLAFLPFSVSIGLLYQFVVMAPFDGAQVVGSFFIFFGPILSFFPSFFVACLQGGFETLAFPFMGMFTAALLQGLLPFFYSTDVLHSFLANFANAVTSTIVCLIAGSLEKAGYSLRNAGLKGLGIAILSGYVHIGLGESVKSGYLAKEGYFAQDWFQLGVAIWGVLFGALAFGEGDFYSWIHFGMSFLGGGASLIVSFGIQLGIGWNKRRSLREILVKDRRDYEEAAVQEAERVAN